MQLKPRLSAVKLRVTKAIVLNNWIFCDGKLNYVLFLPFLPLPPKPTVTHTHRVSLCLGFAKACLIVLLSLSCSLSVVFVQEYRTQIVSCVLSMPLRINFQANLERVIALWEYDAGEPGELSFCAGDVINVLGKDSSGWWRGSSSKLGRNTQTYALSLS